MFEQFVKWKYGMFGDVFSHLSEVVFVDDISNMACFWWMEILMFLLKVKKVSFDLMKLTICPCLYQWLNEIKYW